MEREQVVYREEITAVIGALADMLVELRAIRSILENGEEEEEHLDE